MRRLSAVALFAALATAPLSAQTLYNGGAVNTAGYFGNPDLNQAEIFETFTLSSNSTITGFSFWAVSWNGTDVDETAYWNISSKSGAASSAPTVLALSSGITSAPVSTGLTVNGGKQIYRYDVTFSPLSLTAGTYWLGLHNGPLSAWTATGFYWAPTTAAATWVPTNTATADNNSPTAGRYALAPNGTPAYTSAAQYAFTINGLVDGAAPAAVGDVAPEPATMTLLATGLVSLAAASRRRKK